MESFKIVFFVFVVFATIACDRNEQELQLDGHLQETDVDNQLTTKARKIEFFGPGCVRKVNKNGTKTYDSFHLICSNSRDFRSFKKDMKKAAKRRNFKYPSCHAVRGLSRGYGTCFLDFK